MSLGAEPEHYISFVPQRYVCTSVLSIMGLIEDVRSPVTRSQDRLGRYLDTIAALV